MSVQAGGGGGGGGGGGAVWPIVNFSKFNSIVIQPAIPMVVQGKGIRFNLPPDCPTILFPFETSMGPIYAAITVKWMS